MGPLTVFCANVQRQCNSEGKYLGKSTPQPDEHRLTNCPPFLSLQPHLGFWCPTGSEAELPWFDWLVAGLPQKSGLSNILWESQCIIWSKVNEHWSLQKASVSALLLLLCCAENVSVLFYILSNNFTRFQFFSCTLSVSTVIILKPIHWLFQCLTQAEGQKLECQLALWYLLCEQWGHKEGR